MVQQVLNEKDDVVLDIVQARLAVDDVDLCYAEGVLQLDEAVEILDKSDHSQVKDEQIKMHSRAETRSVFSKDYRAKKIAVRDLAGPPAKKPKKGAKVPETRVIVPSKIPQAGVRHLTPPGGHIWVGHTKENWNGHLPPRKRISAPWRDFETGEQGSLKDILNRLWLQYAELQGVDVDSLVKFD